jgi:hypothetical protein
MNQNFPDGLGDVQLEQSRPTFDIVLLDQFSNQSIVLILAGIFLCEVGCLFVALRQSGFPDTISKQFANASLLLPPFAFRFAARRLSPSLVRLRLRMLKGPFSPSFAFIAFNRSSLFFKNATIVRTVFSPFLRSRVVWKSNGESNRVDLVCEEMNSTCDTVSYSFSFLTDLRGIQSLNFLWTPFASEKNEFICQMNRNIAMVSLYSLCCFVFLNRRRVFLNPLFLLLILSCFSFVEWRLAKASRSIFTCCLKLILFFGVTRCGSWFVAALIPIHEFADCLFNDYMRMTNHLGYLVLVVIAVFGTPGYRREGLKVGLYGALLAVSAAASVGANIVVPIWVPLEGVAETLYLTTHWLVALALAISNMVVASGKKERLRFQSLSG